MKITHIFLISAILLFAIGCGYKADPVYVEKKEEIKK